MKICKVVGNVWATKKDPDLECAKLMLVTPLYDSKPLLSPYTFI